jgi:hypothetical protein
MRTASLVSDSFTWLTAFPLSVLQSRKFAPGWQEFGLRWQSHSGDSALGWTSRTAALTQSGVALRFPPQSKIGSCGFAAPGASMSICGKKILL